jgi:hypothetical protein
MTVRLVLAANINRFPCEGPKASGYFLIFDSAESITVNLYELTANRGMTLIPSVYVDNADNDLRVEIVVMGSGQRICIPARSQGFVPVLGQNPLELRFTLDSAPAAPVTIYFQALNFATNACVWNSDEAVLPWPANLCAGGVQGFLFDNTALYTMFADTSLSTPISNGVGLAAQLDLSGNGNHRTQSTLAFRPIFNRDPLTGRCWLQYDGATKYMVAPSLRFDDTDKINYSVGCSREQAGLGMLFDYGNAAPNYGTMVVCMNLGGNFNGTAARGVIGAPAGSTTKLGPLNNPETIVLTAEIDMSRAYPNTIRQWCNGFNFGADGGTPSGGGNFGSYSGSFGRNAGAASLYYAGKDYSCAFIGRTLTGPERIALDRWIGERTGIVMP